MMELREWMQNKSLSLEQIKNKNQEEVVLVNVNRIYTRYSEMIRNNLVDKYQILLKVIDNIYDEKEMYTLMTAQDIIICFDSQEVNYPENTFLCRDGQSQDFLAYAD